MAEKKSPRGLSFLIAIKNMLYVASCVMAALLANVTKADSFTDFCAPPPDEKISKKWAGKGGFEDDNRVKELGSLMRYRDAGNTLALQSNSYNFKGEDNTQVLIPDPESSIVLNGKAVPFVIQENKVESCSQAILKLQTFQPIANDRTYACALLGFDRSCLTASASQPNISDSRIPKRSLVVMSFFGKAFCTGLLLDEKTLLTSRHCFIRQSNGNLLTEFNASELSGLNIQTLDLMRTVTLSKETIVKLKLASGFDIDKDPVKIPVETAKAPSAQGLPKVLFKPAQAKQLLWIAGPFALLDQAVAMQKAYTEPGISAPRVTWQDSIRWSNSNAAQCTVAAVSQSCIYHTCQTSEGYSGSPMISAAYSTPTGGNDVIEVVGVHSGTPGAAQNGGWPACAISSANFDASDYSAYNVGKSGGL